MRTVALLSVVAGVCAASLFSSLAPAEAEESGELSFPTDADGAFAYPTVLIATLVRNKAHTLPYFLGQLEELDYPKDKISLFIRSDHNTDDSSQILETWTESVQDLYGDIDLEIVDNDVGYDNEEGPFDWVEPRYLRVIRLKEEALRTAEAAELDFLWLLDADQLLTFPRTLFALMMEKKPLVAPVMAALDSNYSNFWGGMNEDGYYARSPDYIPILKRHTLGAFPVPMAHSNLLVDLRVRATRQLSFMPDKLGFEDVPYSGPLDDVLILARSVAEAGLQFFVSNRYFFGWLLEPPTPDARLEADVENMRHLALELMQEGPPGLLHSPAVRPFPGEPTRLGFERLYLINLRRRPERRRRMEAAAATLGLRLDYWEATDGRALSEDGLSALGIRPMPEFKDPYGKRPLTLGEIGCFMSHFRIWEDVVDKQLDSVLVLEDDLRFVKFFRQYVKVIMDNAKESNLEWDLIYFGRKRLEPDSEGRAVPGNPFISSVAYSYWTLSYALSKRGAEKLLAAAPLEALLPVDEFLPIMFDEHPESAWKAYFPKRDLKAFTAEPLLVYPTHYTGEVGHFSDTEKAAIIPANLIAAPPKDEL